MFYFLMKMSVSLTTRVRVKDFFFIGTVKEVSPLCATVVVAVTFGRESGTADQSQSNPREGATQESPDR